MTTSSALTIPCVECDGDDRQAAVNSAIILPVGDRPDQDHALDSAPHGDDQNVFIPLNVVDVVPGRTRIRMRWTLAPGCGNLLPAPGVDAIVRSARASSCSNSSGTLSQWLRHHESRARMCASACGVVRTGLATSPRPELVQDLFDRGGPALC